MLSLFQFPEETCVDENDRQGPARSQVTTMMSLTREIVMIVRKPEKVILSPQPSKYSTTSKYSNDLPEIDVSTVLEGSPGELHKIPAN